jgi:PhzF family phenazine biosynthesis protein
MKLPYFEVAAFTQRPFAGNPAGVCLLEKWLPDALLQSIATENNLAETAFVVPSGDVCELRWFTPTVEMDLCGHATLGSAHILFRHQGVEAEKLRFQSPRSGELGVERDGDRFVLDFPSRIASRCEVTPELTKALGRQPQELYQARDYMAVFEREEDIRSLEPDFAALGTLPNAGVIVTAPGRDCDFVSRFFAPELGVQEDPVTGSTHCNLIPYWAERLGKQKLFARQLSKRGGELFCENRADRVRIGGYAVTYLVGEITVPNES